MGHLDHLASWTNSAWNSLLTYKAEVGTPASWPVTVTDACHHKPHEKPAEKQDF